MRLYIPLTALCTQRDRLCTTRLCGGSLSGLIGIRLSQVFGNSPDETAYCRLVLNKETVPEALTAIQPTLLAYGFDAPPTPVLLDVSSIQPDRILLLVSGRGVASAVLGLQVSQLWTSEPQI